MMSHSKRIYVNDDWTAFSEKVKRRDGYKCLQCGRGTGEVTLQVHHEVYVAGKAPWEYALSDCLTLCKGCHAKEHGLIKPDRG
jgi:5-methylcytosine-specific restriction endonuclease McrA